MNGGRLQEDGGPRPSIAVISRYVEREGAWPRQVHQAVVGALRGDVAQTVPDLPLDSTCHTV